MPHLLCWRLSPRHLFPLKNLPAMFVEDGDDHDEGKGEEEEDCEDGG